MLSKGDEIPDGEFLFRYINPDAIPRGQREVPEGIFNDRDLSCDWERIQKSPETSFHVGHGKTRIVIIEICDEVRNPRNPKQAQHAQPAWRQQIIYDPIENDPDFGPNPAHSLIRGLKRLPIRVALATHSKWRDLQ